jgi:hypothetical protein
VPSSTQPNRLFVHSGTSGGATSNDRVFVLLLRTNTVITSLLGWES